MSTSVIVNNGEVLVLGGLMSDQNAVVNHKVPILGDIPGIGALFRDQQNSLEKRNLVVFIRPIILQDNDDNIRVTNSKYRYIRDQQFVNSDISHPFGFGDHTKLPARRQANQITAAVLGCITRDCCSLRNASTRSRETPVIRVIKAHSAPSASNRTLA